MSAAPKTKHRFVIRTADRVRDIMRMAYLAATQLAANDEVFEVILCPVKSRRTLEQNALMWAMLGDIAKVVPWVIDGVSRHIDAEDWKDIFTAALRHEMRVAQGINGGVVLLGARTSRMTVAQMSDLIELMNAFCAERGILLPEHRFIEHWEQAA